MHYKIAFIGHNPSADGDRYIIVVRPTGSCGNVVKDQLFQSYSIGMLNSEIIYCRSMGALRNHGLKEINAKISSLRYVYNEITEDDFPHPLDGLWALLGDLSIDMTFSVLQGSTKTYGN